LIAERPAPELIGEAGDASAPAMQHGQLRHNLAHRPALPDDVGLDDTSDIHKLKTPFFCNIFLYSAQKVKTLTLGWRHAALFLKRRSAPF